MAVRPDHSSSCEYFTSRGGGVSAGSEGEREKERERFELEK